VLATKQALAEQSLRAAGLLHDRLPWIPMTDCSCAFGAIATYLTGLWPAAHPGPVVAEVLSRPELAAMKPDFEKDLARFIEVFLSGLASVSPART
jgi:hypothetical protein